MRNRLASAVLAAILAVVLAASFSAAVGANPLGIPETEYEALTALYSSTDGANWTNNTNWLTAVTPWYGVTVENGHVTSLDLYLNNLAGPLPAELGNLNSVQWLALGDNHLTGSIPTTFGNMASLRWLILEWNELTGSIPSELGNLANLEWLILGSNLLTGEIPNSIADLENLEEDWGLDLAFNGLWSTDPDVIVFLAHKQPGWRETQTVAPLGVSAVLPGGGEVYVSWTPILFADGDGYYEVGYSSTPGGPYTFDPVNRTSHKWESSITISGLNTANPVYVVVRTVSEAGLWNQSTLTSGLSEEVMAVTVGPLGIPEAEYDALVALYISANGNGWADRTNWFTSSTPWYGVTIEDYHVVGLDLKQNDLAGTIPPQIGDLSHLEVLDLFDNYLTGSIPAELGNLKNLKELYLSGNELTGSIPAALGGLGRLEWLDFYDNQLTGSIPPEVGSLFELWALDLSGNQLNGAIPAELGNLANLNWLVLEDNRLTGPIPAQLGQLVNLSVLFLGSNGLTGEIPHSFVDLTNLSDVNGLDVSYNGLWSSDGDVIAFLAEKQSDWQDTQTVPPTDVLAVFADVGKAAVWWSPVAYTADPGYFEVGSSHVSAGPYTFLPQNRTSSKFMTSVDASDLPIGHQYFVVRTVTTPHAQNQSTVTSAPSRAITAVPGLSKLRADGAGVGAAGAVVTAVFPDCFYAEKEDRSWGIRVESAQVPTASRVHFVGTTMTNEDGERYIEASSVQNAGLGRVSPLGLGNRAVGGTNLDYHAASGAGQQGVYLGTGLNNIGLLVTTWGVVQSVDADSGTFVISDGSLTRDLISHQSTPVNVKVVVPGGVALPQIGSYVSVTGISSCEKIGDELHSLLRVRSQSDILIL